MMTEGIVLTKLLSSAYLFIPALFIIYKLISFIQYKIRSKSNGCKPPTVHLNDGWYGFKIAKELMSKKQDGSLIDFFHSRFEDNSADTLTARVAGVKNTNTRDPENIKAILGTQFNDFDLGVRHRQFLPLLGDGIFTLDGQGWKHSRAMLRPQFSREQIAHVKSLEPHIQQLFEHIRLQKGKIFDMQELFYKFTIDTSTQFLFGESCDSLADGINGQSTGEVDEYLKKNFPHAFNHSQGILATRSILQDLYWIFNPPSFKNDCKIVHGFTDFYVNKALNTPSNQLDEKSKDGYIFLYELAKQTRDPKILRDQALNILVAGRDTTAGLLSFTFYELSRRPEVFEKLKLEIFEHFGSGKEVRLEEVTFESLKRCEYLKAVINETLRLYPSVPVNFRTANKDTTLPRGGGADQKSKVYIPKGLVVLYAISSCHRNAAIYGKDADVFRPERWFEDNTRKLGWAYLPFNGGPRICLGQQFALTEASYVITRLIQEFGHLSTNEIDYPPKKNSQLTMCLQDGCNVSMY